MNNINLIIDNWSKSFDSCSYLNLTLEQKHKIIFCILENIDFFKNELLKHPLSQLRLSNLVKYLIEAWYINEYEWGNMSKNRKRITLLCKDLK